MVAFFLIRDAVADKQVQVVSFLEKKKELMSK
jgi:hypothetical protein